MRSPCTVTREETNSPATRESLHTVTKTQGSQHHNNNNTFKQKQSTGYLEGHNDLEGYMEPFGMLVMLDILI